MSSPLVSIIIINCNGEGFLQRCFESLYCQSYQDFELIFIDNGSTDDSVQYVRGNFPDVIIIENKKNLGFARANNQGIEISKGKYIALLNNDTVVDKNWRYLIQIYAIALKKGAGGRFVEDFSGLRLFIALIKALWGAMKGMPLMIRKRQYIQKNSMVSKKEVKDWFKRYGMTIKEIVLKD